MKTKSDKTIEISLCAAVCLAFLLAGCAGRNGEGKPPTESTLQQQNNTVMNDPHVPDSVKQRLRDQQEASRAAAKGYTAEMQKKQANSR